MSLLVLLASMANPAAAGSVTFTVANDTTHVVQEVWISAAGENSWTTELLGASADATRVLDVSETESVTLDEGTWDVLVKLSDGTELLRMSNVQVTSGGTLHLTE